MGFSILFDTLFYGLSSNAARFTRRTPEGILCDYILLFRIIPKEESRVNIRYLCKL